MSTKGAFIGIILLSVSTYAIKMSLLCFYTRLFRIEIWFRRTAYALMVISTIWVIASVVAFCNICHPLESFWNKFIPGKCSSGNNFFLGTSLSDTIIDIAIILLPMRLSKHSCVKPLFEAPINLSTAFKLQLPRRTKVAVAGIFALGGFVVVTNLVRLSFVYRPHDNFGTYVRFCFL